jgi:hypothetical protein
VHLVLALLLASSCFAVPARAQTAAPAQEGALPERLLHDALAEYELGNWSGAQALFTRVHLLQPSARTRRGLGYVAFNLRQFARALAELDASLRDPTRPLDPALRAQVEALMLRAEPYVARVRLALRPEHALLLVDGQPALRDARGQLLLDLGVHGLRASAPGFSPLEKSLTVHDSRAFALSFSLTPRALADPASAYALRTRRFTWVLAATSLVCALAGTAVWLAADKRYQQLERDCRARGGCFAHDLHGDDVKRLDHAAFGLWGAAGALTLSAALTWLWTTRETRARPASITHHAPRQLARAQLEVYAP